MPKPSEYDKTHLRNMAAMGTRIDRIFKKATEEAAKIGVSIKDVDPDKVFSFDDYPETKKQIERLLQALKDTTETTIANGVRSAWTLSNNKNNALASRIFGDNVGKLTKEQYRQYFSTNDNALQAFLQRQTNGLNLSDRVWKYTNAFKSEIELGLDLGIRSGLDAPKMARELKQYLQHPDKLFRRVRDEHGNLQLSKAAAEFHPGRGVYRSSYKNARRLAATETNIAYRTSDHLRWQQMDFVVGIEIKTSNNHTLLGQDGKPHPFYDICDTLAGKYPKDFKFTGWHPHCRCHVETILKTEEEMMADNERILAGEDVSETSENTVKEVPQAFKDHIEKYAERIEQTAPGRLPYYIQDNRQRIDKMLGTQPQLSPQEIAAERHAARTPQDAQSIQERWNRSRLNALQEAINNGYLPEDCKARLAELAKLNTPEHFDDFQAQIKTLQNAAARHAARTEAQAAAIQTRWDEKLFRDAKTQRDANRVLTLAKSYSEVDYAQLEKLIAQNNLTAMDAETQKVLQALKDMRAEERALQDLIPNVHDWHKQFTLAELKEAHKGIEDTIEFWKTKYGADLAAKTNLTKLQSELEQKIKFVEDPGAFKAGAVRKKYWQVQQAGYKQQLTLTKNEIWLQETTKDYNDLLGFKTKSADFKFYMEKAKEAIDKGNAADAHHYVDLANWKKNSLEARRKTKGVGTALSSTKMNVDDLYQGGCPYTADEIKKLKAYESKIISNLMTNGVVENDLIDEYYKYTLSLSEKYYSKQLSLFTAEEQTAMKKAAERYLKHAKTNPGIIWGDALGGVYSDFDTADKIPEYLKKALFGLTDEELSIVKRFTNGSTFSNCYNLRNESDFWRQRFLEKIKDGKLKFSQIKDQYQLIEDWSQGANYTLDRMVRYNGLTFRGLTASGGQELRETIQKAFDSGKPWINNASCSTSTKYRVAKSFDGDFIMILHNRTGAYIHEISDYSSEFEVMTLRRTKYRIIKPPTFVNGRWFAELEEI